MVDRLALGTLYEASVLCRPRLRTSLFEWPSVLVEHTLEMKVCMLVNLGSQSFDVPLD